MRFGVFVIGLTKTVATFDCIYRYIFTKIKHEKDRKVSYKLIDKKNREVILSMQKVNDYTLLFFIHEKEPYCVEETERFYRSV